MNYDRIIVEMLSRIQTLEEQVAELKNIQQSETAKENSRITTSDIRAYINQRISEAAESGRASLTLKALDIHNSMGLTSRYPMVCNAMRQCMGPEDRVIFETRSGYSSTLEIEYRCISDARAEAGKMIFKICHGFSDYEKDAWELLKAGDREFIPPLSSRESTTQTELKPKAGKVSEPVSYFEQLLRQDTVIALLDGKLIAFMSFIKEKEVILQKDKKAKGTYVSTVLVDRAFRGRGIAREFYSLLMKHTDGDIITRTWSTNSSHIGLLEKLGFEVIDTIKNDRGKGIDTVYLRKERHE